MEGDILFNIRIAGIVAGIENRYALVRRLCADYICDDSPDFTVAVSDDEIEKEKRAVESSVSDAYDESVCL